MKYLYSILTILIIAVSVFMTACNPHTSKEIIHLQCEGLTNPLGIDQTIPHFSWQLTSTNQQTAYQILVASSKELLAEGKADLWDSDTAFAAGLTGAPSKEEMKPGQVFSGVKKKEVVKAFRVPEGTVFQGAEGHPQTADKGGAYIVKDSNGMRLVQADAFHKSYQITKQPMSMAKEKVKE